ncbi:MAG: MBL fold metallo-hydrolase [Gammaproteobacteria bacterium]|nr:MBL fold metallo-hydrolase [Gammaproteobacteria bacterium]
MALVIKTFFHQDSFTYSYVVADTASTCAVVIDPVLDFDPAAGRTDTKSVDTILAFIKQEGFKVDWVLETHAHADHLSAAPYLKEHLSAKIGIGEGIRFVQQTFAEVFNLGANFPVDGRQFDRLFKDGDRVSLGKYALSVMHTPGHTNDSVTYLVEDAAFVGDTLFMPDSGTARCDFPGGDAGLLYDSIQKILALPDKTRLFMCHDYGANGNRDCRNETTVAEQKDHNIHVGDGKTRDEFISLRTARDANLEVPKLLLPAVQVNIRAGNLPEPEENGSAYLKIPLNKF